jgi:hypothetical protein
MVDSRRVMARGLEQNELPSRYLMLSSPLSFNSTFSYTTQLVHSDNNTQLTQAASTRQPYTLPFYVVFVTYTLSIQSPSPASPRLPCYTQHS